MAGYRSESTGLKYKRDPNFTFEMLPRIRSYGHWYIVENQYPYDRVAEVHHMLVPIRRFSERGEMEYYESDELRFILRELALNEEYDSLIENFPHERTVPEHFHLHLIKLLKT